MTTTSVKNRIQSARADSHISGTEAKNIIKAAEKTAAGNKSPVTGGEGKAIKDLYYSAVNLRPWDHSHPPPLGFPGAPHIDQEAFEKLEAFFAKHDIPAGENQAAVAEKITAALDAMDDHGAPLAKKPKLSAYYEVELPNDAALMDAPMRVAHYDPRKQKFYLQSIGGFAGPVFEQWYGPFSLGDAPEGPKKVSTATIMKIRGAFSQLQNVDWSPTPPLMPAGQAITTVGFAKDAGFDGYSYSAMLPSGALTQHGATGDPNQATSFVVVRTGGLAGLTEYAGPFDL